MFPQQLLNDHAADRMPNENGFGCADLPQEILQRVRERSNANGWKQRRSAIARHVPGDGAIAMLKKIQLAAPRPRRAADSMQEHQRRHAGVAGGHIAKTVIFGFHGREMRHAGPPVKSDLPMLTGPRRLKSNNFIFKAILGSSDARRFNQSLASGGRKLTSCSAEMRTISSTSVRLCNWLNSASSFPEGDTQNRARAGLSDLLK